MQFEGELVFRAAKSGYREIEDTYQIRGLVRRGFPRLDADVFETGGRIPDGYHKFEGGILCLGSPIKIQKVLTEEPTLVGLVERLVIPYLYNRSHYEQTGEFPVGDLAHGAPGLVADYENLFRLKGARGCAEALALLGMKKGVANKRPCPCGSGRRLGRCHCRWLTPLRRLAPRNRFKRQALSIRKELNL